MKWMCCSRTCNLCACFSICTHASVDVCVCAWMLLGSSAPWLGSWRFIQTHSTFAEIWHPLLADANIGGNFSSSNVRIAWVNALLNYIIATRKLAWECYSIFRIARRGSSMRLVASFKWRWASCRWHKFSLSTVPWQIGILSTTRS